MINIYLFLSLTFLFTFLVGRLLQKIRIPWIFAALLLGAVFAIYNPFSDITSSATFNFLADLGMYFLLFIIGFEIDLKQVRVKRSFIFKATFFIIFLEGLFGGLLIHYVFNYNWFISFIVALSFSTVGEAILIPILDEFKLIKTRLGQAILGIGVLDDFIEILVLVLVILFIGTGIYGHLSILLIFSSLLGLFFMAFSLTKLRKQGEKFHFFQIETMFLFVIAILFLFLGIGEYAEATALGAILAGVGLRTFVPNERLDEIEKEVKAVCYGLFAPIFFLWAGLGMDMNYLSSYFFLVLLVIIVSAGSKYLGSYIAGRNELGLKQSILLGTGLSVKFSTSIVVLKVLYENNIIDNDLYSVVIASSIVFTFIVPIIFSQLLKKYQKEIK